jgi:hypothetical protein
MKRTALTLAAVLSAGVLCAESINNPDENTLWLEDGKDIKTASGITANAWNSDLKYTSLEGGKGFQVETVDKVVGGKYIGVSAEYPWLVYEITNVEIIPKKYVGLSMGISGFACGTVLKVPAGIYAFNIYDNSTVPAKGQAHCRIDQYGLKLTYAYMKMVKEPENYIKIDSEAFAAKKAYATGDKLKFTVKLKDPAADVMLSFFHSYTMPAIDLGGGKTMQLKQEDKEGKVWSGELTVGTLPAKPAPSHRSIMVKADITGGTVTVPLWTNIAYKYDDGAKK